jgi:hypothetical protein
MAILVVNVLKVLPPRVRPDEHRKPWAATEDVMVLSPNLPSRASLGTKSETAILTQFDGKLLPYSRCSVTNGSTNSRPHVHNIHYVHNAQVKHTSLFRT